jgi:hypothetical protein
MLHCIGRCCAVLVQERMSTTRDDLQLATRYPFTDLAAPRYGCSLIELANAGGYGNIELAETRAKIGRVPKNAKLLRQDVTRRRRDPRDEVRHVLREPLSEATSSHQVEPLGCEIHPIVSLAPQLPMPLADLLVHACDSTEQGQARDTHALRVRANVSAR